MPYPMPLLPPVTRMTLETRVSGEDSASTSALDAFTWSRYRPLRYRENQAYADAVTNARTDAHAARRPGATVITNARSGNSQEMSTRMRRYSITMAFRTACFISMIFVDGWARWVLLGGAVLLPYVAVVFANQANRRSQDEHEIEHGEPSDLPQLTSGEVISGDVIDDDEPMGQRERDVA